MGPDGLHHWAIDPDQLPRHLQDLRFFCAGQCGEVEGTTGIEAEQEVRGLRLHVIWCHRILVSSYVVCISGMQTLGALPQGVFRGGADLTPRLGIDVLLERNTGLL